MHGPLVCTRQGAAGLRRTAAPTLLVLGRLARHTIVTVALAAWPLAPATAGDSAPLLERIERGDVSGAVTTYRSSYDPTSARGLQLLRRMALTVLRQDLGGADPYESNGVAAILGAEGDERAFEVLEQGLASPNPLVRATAAEGLARIGNARASSALRSLYQRGGEGPRVVLGALQHTDHRWAIPLYVEALRSADPNLRILALRGLGELRAREARGELEQVLERESDPLVLSYVYFSMAAIGDDRGLSLLKANVHSERAEARDAAAGLLGSLEDASAAVVLREALEDPSPFVRLSASASLTRLHDPAGLPRIEQSLESPDLPLRLAAAGSLGRVDYPLARPLVLKALRSRFPYVRAVALRAIRTHQDRSTLAELIHVVDHEPEPFVRVEAILALGQLGDPHTIERLLTLLPTPELEVRHACAESLIALVDRLLPPSPAGAGP